MKIVIGSDHAGFRYKERIKGFLRELGHDVEDLGTFSEEAVDYPRYIRPVAEAVARGEYERGIVLGGSGNGEAIVANRVSGVRCTLCWNTESTLFARRHNDSNVLSLGQRMISEKEALEIVKVWMETPFDGGRHLRRIQMIDAGSEDRFPEEPGKRPVRPGKPQEPPPAVPGQPPAQEVFIAFRYIRYTEGEESITFNVEPGLKTATIIKVPSVERWRAEFPDWAKDRRDEILDRLRTKCSHMNIELKEF